MHLYSINKVIESFPKIYILCLLIFLCPQEKLFAQSKISTSQKNTIPYYHKVDHTKTKWFLEMQAEKPNVLLAQAYFQAYFEKHPKERSKQRKLFIRWYNTAKLNVDNNGFLKKQQFQTYKAFGDHQKTQTQQRSNANTWRMIGPNYAKKTRCNGNSNFMSGGYVDRVYINPFDTQNMYAGYSYGGLWVSQDQGSTWSLTDAEFPNGTNSYANNDRYYGDIKAAKSNPSTVYAATEAGLLKSINKGTTWIYCKQLNRTVELHKRPYFLAVSPNNPNIIISTFGRKVYQSTNGGESWSLAFDNSNGGNNHLFTNQHVPTVYGLKDRPFNFFGLEADFGNPNVFYLGAWNNNNEPCIYKSTNGGRSFNLLMNLNQKNNRIMPAHPKLQTIGASPGKFFVYSEWETNEKIYTYNSSGQLLKENVLKTKSEAGDIAWHNENVFYNGYYASSTIDKTTNGGSTFTDMMQGSYGGCPDGNKYVHPDVRAIDVVGNLVLIGTDGGLTLSKDGMLTAKTIGDEVSSADLWGFSSSLKSDICVAGMDHGPSTVRTFDGLGGWQERGGGDAIHSSVNHSNDRWVYYDTRNGVFKEYVNEDGSLSQRQRFDPPYKIKELEFHPNIFTIGYGFRNKTLYRTNDHLITYEPVYTFDINISSFKLSKADPNVMYVLLQNEKIQRSIDGGLSWQSITPSSVSNMIAITLGDTPDEVYVALGNVQNTKKILQSTDGGINWKNITTNNLPQAAVSAITYQQGTDGGVYMAFAGMHGVWYKNNQLTEWKKLGVGLPMFGYVQNIFAVPNKGKYRMGSSRGAWEHDLYETSNPIAQFSVESNKVTCSNQLVHFIQNSVATPGAVSYAWTFEGGKPNTSTEASPSVSYTTAGRYDVTLTITDKNGQKSSKTLEDFIIVTEDCESNLLTVVKDNFDCDKNIPQSTWVMNGQEVLIKDFSQESGTIFYVKLNASTDCNNNTARLTAILNTDKNNIKVLEYNHFNSIESDPILGNNTSNISSLHKDFAQISYRLEGQKLYFKLLNHECGSRARVNTSCWSNTCKNTIPQGNWLRDGEEVLIKDFASESEKLFFVNLNAFTNCYNTSANLIGFIDIDNQKIHVEDYFHFNNTTKSLINGNHTATVTSISTDFAQISYRLDDTKLYYKLINSACRSVARINPSCWLALGASCTQQGNNCDDGDECTINDKYDANCNCKGTFLDSDQDGICDAKDDTNGNCTFGLACNDGDECTINDKYDANCNCKGTFLDSDQDGICDAKDDTNGNCTFGLACNDGDECTVNDKYDANCNCKGTFLDSDQDGICDAKDDTNGNCTLGLACDDGKPNTIDDKYDANCNCTGKIDTIGNEEEIVSCGEVNIVHGNSTIAIKGKTGKDYFFHIFDASWQYVYGCGWQCGNEQIINNLSSGEYIVLVRNNNWVTICNSIIKLKNKEDIDLDNDGYLATEDCDDTNANITIPGATCDDNNSATINDKLQEDCSCLGEQLPDDELKEISCGKTSIQYGNGQIIMKGEISKEYYFSIFDNQWNPVYQCSWNCGHNQQVKDLEDGRYRVIIRNNNWQILCNQIIQLKSNSNEGTNNTITCGAIKIRYGMDSITMSGLDNQAYYFKLNDLDNGWKNVFNCTWQCGHEQIVTGLNPSRYLVSVYNSDWTEHCSTEIELEGNSLTKNTATSRSKFTNIDSPPIIKTIEIFPNPAKDELFINLKAFAGKQSSIQISNQYGQLVQTLKITTIPSGLIKLNTSELLNGLYFVNIKLDESKEFTKKVLIHRDY